MKFNRQQKKQAAREGEKVQSCFDRLQERFQRELFSEDCPDDVFTRYNNEWIKWAKWYNNQMHISIADPRAFYTLNIQK